MVRVVSHVARVTRLNLSTGCRWSSYLVARVLSHVTHVVSHVVRVVSHVARVVSHVARVVRNVARVTCLNPSTGSRHCSEGGAHPAQPA